MKKYKLVKIYPGCETLGLIIDDKNCQLLGYHHLSYEDRLSKYPEYWEEIIEYPIGTKARDTRINKTFTKEIDGWYTASRTAHTDKSISDAKWINIIENKMVEKPIFTTFDNVDIYEGDEVYAVSDNFELLYTSFVMKNRDEKVRGFFTKEAAEEYINLRKPYLSMQDLKSTGCLSEKQWFVILELVKHKSKL